MDMRSGVEFANLEGIGDVSEKMVETRKNIGYPLVFKLLTSALVLPVVTSTVKRVFYAMKIVNRNQMGDQWMLDSLIVYMGRDFL